MCVNHTHFFFVNNNIIKTGDLNNDNVIKARIHEQEFDAAPWMCQQARDFQNLAREFAQDDVIIEVCGSGTLLYAMAQAMTQPITTRI